jgi:sulfonate transport system substrate-binding protein
MRTTGIHRPRPTRPSPPRSTRTARLTAVLVAAVAATTLAACGSSSPSSTSSSGSAAGGSSPSATVTASNAASTKPAKVVSTGSGGVTLRVGDQAGTGAQSLLTAAGLLNKLPFKVSWSDFTSGPPMLQALSAGDLDVGGVGDAPPVFAAAGGAKLAIVGALANDPNSAALLVPKNSSIHAISQLKGKKIAVAQGSSADYHLLTVLNKAGLSVHDVTLEYLQPAEALAALSSGAVDAWDVWSPFVEQAVHQDGARVLVNGQGYGSNFSYTVASTSAIANPKISKEITEYLKVLDQAHTWADTHAAAWAKVWAQATGLPNATMVAAAGDDVQHPIPVTASTTSAEQSLVDAFAKAGLIPSDYSFGKYVVTSFNSTVGGGQ